MRYIPPHPYGAVQGQNRYISNYSHPYLYHRALDQAMKDGLDREVIGLERSPNVLLNRPVTHNRHHDRVRASK